MSLNDDSHAHCVETFVNFSALAFCSEMEIFYTVF